MLAGVRLGKYVKFDHFASKSRLEQQVLKAVSLKKNCPKLIIDNFEFTEKLETKSTAHWKCFKWRSPKCHKTAITVSEVCLALKHKHNHDSVPGKHKHQSIPDGNNIEN